MDEIFDFFSGLFSTDGLTARRETGNWTEFHAWFHVISDLLIWSAYLAIPIIIYRYVAQRSGSKFGKTYSLFALFILVCGTTYLLDAISFWAPIYRLDALVRFGTGIASWITVFHLVNFLPVASSMPTHEALESEIQERRNVEKELKILNQHLNAAQEIARIGHWQWDIGADKVSWSDELFKIYGMDNTGGIRYDEYLERIHPDDREFVNTNIQNAFTEKMFPSFTHRIVTPGGVEKVIQSRGEVITDAENNPVKMIGTAQDITDVQTAQQQLVERTHELETSNAELQKFAYVASHDLQEPLRKIVTFATLLEKELPQELTGSAKVYMNKIVESSSRMQRLIDDILQFSSLRSGKQAFEKVDLGQVIQNVHSDLEVKITNAGARINVSDMPVIEAIPSQMAQLFQNLIINAIKFRKPDVEPVITISSRIIQAADLENYDWINHNITSLQGVTFNWSREQFAAITIEDNGIGFDNVHSKKIFEIFQRLHNTGTYSGTGIGLAICNKIVDNHHGLITASSKSGEGAAFTIVLPLSQKNFLSDFVKPGPSL